MTRPRGNFVLVLHSHLPYVLGHGRWPHGTDWLSEAALETYVPLVMALRRLVHDGISPRITVGITPVLAEQLVHPDFAVEFGRYLEQKADGARADARTFEKEGFEARAELAGHWVRTIDTVRNTFEVELGGDLIGAFRDLQDAGHVEIITSAATHGYLPLLGLDSAVENQVGLGRQVYRRHFGRDPRGIWLPECAYRPHYAWRRPVDVAVDGTRSAGPMPRLGVDEVVAQNGIKYFIVDAHLLQGGKPIGTYLDRFTALRELWEHASEAHREAMERQLEAEKTPTETYLVMSNPDGRSEPVAIFTRHPKVSLQVWSNAHGYPGDAAYLDFHKKHHPGGHRYWRVTGPDVDLGAKEEYDPRAAHDRVEAHAAHFVGLVESIIAEHTARVGETDSGSAKRPAVVCAPFDTELFGHWWHEGVDWIEAVLRRMARSEIVEARTASEDLAAAPPKTVVALPEGSWGEGGFHFIWLNEQTTWVWKHIYADEDRLTALVDRVMESKRADLIPTVHGADLDRVLRQAVRELVLLEGSDWPFLISTKSARDYAELRVERHHEDFLRLVSMAEGLLGGVSLTPTDRDHLEALIERDDLFPEIEYEAFASAAARHPAGTAR